MSKDVFVIIGAGRAGSRAADALRDEGFGGRIVMLGEEVHAPYDRPPPLSKERLFAPDESTGALYTPSFFAEREIELVTGRSAQLIDRSRLTLHLSGGKVVPYDRLLVATGSAPRRLDIPGSNLPSVHTLRSLDDSRRLAVGLAEGRRLVVIGAGLIGLEVASGAAARGLEVTVLEAAPRILGRSVPADIAAAVQSAHVARGVRFILDARITGIAQDGGTTTVRLADGRGIPADLVLIAAGGAPRTELAAEADLAVDNGITTDSHLATSDPDIFAAGDVASFVHPLFRRRLRLEHWHNAEEQGRHVARNMLHAGIPYAAVPWFWSDQYDLSLQGAGIADGTAVAIRPLPEGLAVFHLAPDDRLLGVTAFGTTGPVGRTVSLARRMISASGPIDRRRLGDPATDLKKLVTEFVR